MSRKKAVQEEAKAKIVRDDIGLATCHRLLSKGAGMKDVRISAQAAKRSQKALEDLLGRASKEANQLLNFRKTKTFTVEILIMCLVTNKCYGISESDLNPAPSKGKGGRGLPAAGVERVFRKHLGKDHQISKDAKVALVGASEAYLAALGHNAGLLAAAGGRTTIKESDIHSATKLK